MKEIFSKVFTLLAVGFDKIPILNKLKGARTVVGLLLMAVAYALFANGVINETVYQYAEWSFTIFTGLSLNAKQI